MKERKYYVSGMHCRACEILIEDKISHKKGVGKAAASLSKGEVVIKDGDQLSADSLNNIFNGSGYTFSDRPLKDRGNGAVIKGLFIAFFISVIFYLIGRLGFTGMLNVDSDSSFISFLALGLIAGVSACAALVGGLVLSLSEGWSKGDEKTFAEKACPHISFNLGRLISYAIFGSVLGILGEKMRFSSLVSVGIVIFASVIMVVSGLKMLGIRIPEINISKRFSRSVLELAEKKRKFAPFVSGFLTFFLPCGFTIAAQSAALASGSLLRGGLMMFSFAIGTAPSLFIIGMSGSTLVKDKNRGMMFSAAAGFLLLLFAAFNINSQLNVLGTASLSDVRSSKYPESAKVEEKPASGKQVIKMDAYSYGYKPNYFTVKAGVPVRWEITDRGTSGCTDAVIAKGLIKDQISLTRGKTSVVEFTPETPGRYKFSCWMGMIQGTIEVE
ncbi:MAG: sulfite exporter TauE/SafE family protein [Candidatus Colwellbacteria bacterium]|nr:sulfite exporter TauE/SafE family protein [Candidatus Colwellbacteria bacterium]